MDLTRIVTVALATLALTASSALATSPAAQRYASPSGSGTTCSSEAPCSIAEAINGATTDAEVIVRPGDYGSPQSPLTDQMADNGHALLIHGVAGSPRPHIFSAAPNMVLYLTSTSSTIRNLELNWQADQYGGTAIVTDGSLVDHVVVKASGGSALGVWDYAAMNAVVSNSLLYAKDPSGSAIGLNFFTARAGAYTATVRNVTAYAEGPASTGMALAESSSNGAMTVTVTNSILRASSDGHDITAYTSNAASSATGVLDHSNYADVNSAGPGTESVTPADATNQSAAPLFTDLATGNLHQRAASPTVNAGADDAANGTSDIDGDARRIGSATDIGGDEYVPPAPPADSGSGDNSGSGDQPSGGAITPTEAGPTGSTGTPAVLPTVAAAQCVVPKLRGLSVKQAARKLKLAGCAIGKVTRKRSHGRAGRVIAQSKKAGAHGAAGLHVRVTVSRR